TTPFVHEDTRLFLRDCLDHVVRVSDLIDAYREESSDLMHLHMAKMSNKMNEV
ncbi:MAG: magnesium and cobalt transport protein CorA, partial [Gammaproteobacteria bacterium]|nr:magnesium and cobalt transport protein CorA [Gammaproteobacteria bacterium]